MGKFIGRELPSKVLEALQGALHVVVASVDAQGWPDTAPYSWVVALDTKTVRLGIHAEASTLQNIRNNGKVMLDLLGKGVAVSIRGQARVVRESMSSTPFPTAMVEMNVLEVKDDTVIGKMFTTDAALLWSEAMSESRLAVYEELRGSPKE